MDMCRDRDYVGLDRLASGYLQSVGPVVVVRSGIQERVQVANDPIARWYQERHRCICHTFK